jgi:DNA-binding winged helix-turn-helix (wHTH) protein/Tol biopolymer transport system component
MTDNKCFVFRFDDVEVRDREFVLTKAGEVLPVEPKAFRVLQYLLRNPHKLVTKDELLNAVWSDVSVSENSVARAVAQLRRLLGDDLREPRYIATVPTVGYRFIGKVEVAEDAPGERSTLLEAPNNLGGVPTTPSRQKKKWAWALIGGSVIALCLAAAIWYLHRPLPPPRITGYTQITHDGRRKSLVGTDGTRLYFNQMSGSSVPESIAQVAISGGGIAQIPVALPNPSPVVVSSDGRSPVSEAIPAPLLNPILLDISPDGSSFLVERLGDSAWNVRILGGSARRLPDALCAAFSPDGNFVAYSTLRDVGNPNPGDDEVWLVRGDGTGAHKLASVGGDACYLAWSPDGGSIRFTRGDKIWEMSSTGSGLHKLLPEWRGSADQCCGRWTDDGKFFVFLSEGQIWALDERRGLFHRPSAEPVQLTQGPIRWGRPIQEKYSGWFQWAGPVPGRDGTRIFALGSIPRGEASRFDTKTQRFQPFLGGISAQGVVSSKDGRWIAYVSYPDGVLWKANRDGSDPVQLTDSSMEALLPRWSPDSRQILFLAIPLVTGSSGSERENYIISNWASYIVSADGGSPERLLPEGHGWAASTWSPDGHKIAGTSVSADGKHSIGIFDLATRQIMSVPGSYELVAPRWSPDGQYLAAANWGSERLKIFSFETQQWSEILNKGPIDSTEWSSDGRFIYFRRVNGDPGAFRISIKGGVPEKIADLKDWQDAGWLGVYMGLDPTDAPLMIRDIGSEDIYALTLDSK